MPIIKRQSIEGSTEYNRKPTSFRLSRISFLLNLSIILLLANLTTNLGSLALSSKAISSRADHLKQHGKVPVRSVVPGCTEEFKKQFLDQHNKFRELHGAPPVTYNDELNTLAQDWAMKLGENGQFNHRPDNQYGENLFSKTTSENVINGALPVDDWYEEKVNYTNYYEKEPPNEDTLVYRHFTQVVWKASTEVGVGVAIADRPSGKEFVVVANYKPAGNVAGKYAENVLRAKGSFDDERAFIKRLEADYINFFESG